MVLLPGRLLSWCWARTPAGTSRDYHWYAPYAASSIYRMGYFDVAVAHQASYYNPFLDIPYYWTWPPIPDPAIAPGRCWAGAVQGANHWCRFI